MANSHTRAHAKSGEVMVQSTTTDAPILPIEQLERLAQIAPQRVDWVFQQTELESQERRTQNSRINTFIFVEHILGLLFALLISCAGLGAAVYCANENQPLVAAVLGGSTIISIATAFIKGRQKSSPSAPPKTR